MRIPPSPPFSKGGTSPVPAQAELDFTTTPPFEKGGPGGIPAHQGARTTAAWMENLELLAEAPGGVERLRGLIRDLAVTGKLLPKESSVVAWTWSTLGEQVSGMDSGWSPACLDTPSPAPEVWGVLRTTAVQSLRYIQEENKELPTHLAPRPEAEVMPGDVLFTRAGPMNRVGISCLVASTRPRLMLSDKIIRFRPKAEKLDGRFTALCLNAGVTADYLERAKSGMAASQVNISQAKLKAAPIPLPPLAEQHRIVAKVDELMALCDRLEARQADAQHAHARLVQALLDSLTQARDAEEFQAAWERVAGEFPKIFSTPSSINGLQAAFLCMAAEGKLVPEGEGAQYLPISDLLLGDTLNGCSRKPSETPVGLQILRISAGTGSDDFYVDEADHKWVEVTAAEREKFRLVPNDLLACRFNGNLHYVGSFALYRGTSGVEQVFPDKLIRFRVDVGRALPDYLRFVMNALPARRQIEAFCATTVGNIGISATNLKTVKLRVPSMEEQHRQGDCISHRSKFVHG